MGVWGTELFDDDLALDIKADCEASIENGDDTGSVASSLRLSYLSDGDPFDDRPVVVMVLASLLLDRGIRAHPILVEALDIVRIQDGLERWRLEASPEDVEQRRRVYDHLLARLTEAGIA